MRKVEELKAELTSLKEVEREEESKGLQLRQAHAALGEELEKEKVRSRAHSFLLTFHVLSVEGQTERTCPRFVSMPFVDVAEHERRGLFAY